MTTKKTPAETEVTTSAQDRAIVPEPRDGGNPRFTPRQARALAMLTPGHWITREQLDRGAGASNAPDVIRQIRRKLGQAGIEMQHYDALDRDGKPCRPGRYRMTDQGRERLAQITASNQQGAA